MDDNLYDEFGNYIGPELPEEEEEDEEYYRGQDGDRARARGTNFNDDIEVEQADGDQTRANPDNYVPIGNEKHAIVLHEDKNFYPDAEEIYPGVEVLVMEEDSQPITEPIIPPIVTKEYDFVEKKVPTTEFDYDFLAAMTTKHKLIRNVAFAGSIHHGKTTLIDLFVQDTHRDKWQLDKELKYLDNRKDEQERGISIKAKPISLILQSSREKSYLINILDTPGHPNFSDEITAAFRLVDGVVIVVDVLEGVMLHTEKIIQAAIKENIDIILCINKIDRLVLELKLPPNDAYYKIKSIIDEFNKTVASNSHFINQNYNKSTFVAPELNNIVFASSAYGMIFTLKSYAEQYKQLYNMNIDTEIFAKMLWGDIYYNRELRKFSKKPNEKSPNRSFVEFVLEPMYKILGYTVSEEKEELMKFLAKLGVSLTNAEYKLDPKPLLKLVANRFFGHVSSLVDVLVQKVDDAKTGSKIKIEQGYTGDKNTESFNKIIECDANGPLLIHVAKLYHKYDYNTFDVLGRVLSGTVKKGQIVKILGENFNLRDQEDVVVREVTNLFINQTRYQVEINKMPAGSWVLLEGLDVSINKTALIVSNKDNLQIEIFRPLEFFNKPYIKVSVEPLKPSELPKMLQGLRKINKSYPSCITKVEESGEHVVIGCGELYLDSILYDLRLVYSGIEIKVSDPVVSFCETVIETSAITCTAETNNKKNKFSMIAEPLDKGLSADIEAGLINMEKSQEHNANFLMNKYKWDALTANSILAFGPNKTGSNILIDYTIPTETNRELLYSIKESIIQGFDWAMRDGPLCEEPIKNVKFKILSADVADEPIFRASGQIIPTVRRVCYSSFLMATPRLMEPMLVSEIICPADCIPAVYNILVRRRGHVNFEIPKPGTPFYIINANIPALDSFGYETDLRTHTAGLAFCLSWYDQMTVMPGDPLDRSIKLQPLEPSPPPFLAREAMIKTRRRKGLLEEITISKFFDDPMLMNMNLNIS